MREVTREIKGWEVHLLVHPYDGTPLFEGSDSTKYIEIFPPRDHPIISIGEDPRQALLGKSIFEVLGMHAMARYVDGPKVVLGFPASWMRFEPEAAIIEQLAIQAEREIVLLQKITPEWWDRVKDAHRRLRHTIEEVGTLL